MDRQGATERRSSAPVAIAIEQEEQDLAFLWQRYTAARGACRMGPVNWFMDGWLRLEGDPRPPFPVILVECGTDGVGVVLGMEHPLQPGEQGDLTTQAHGAGCQHRAVRCRQREAGYLAMTLQYAALCFNVPQPGSP